ncbi:MAG: aminoacyl-tRNA deacylase [Candidatus Aenigmatarchaeota archaeon]
MGEEVLQRIKDILETKDIEYRVSEHEPVRTSQEAAEARGSDLEEGVKSMVLETSDGEYIMSLVPADREVDLERMRDLIGENVKLADPDDVLERTGCEVGSVPPFGFEVGMETYMDRRILESDRVNFNAGLKTVSIEMKPEKLREVIRPEMCKISR